MPTDTSSLDVPGSSKLQVALPPGASLLQGPEIVDRGSLKPLTFSSVCEICRLPIQPSTTRFHCPHCSTGNYEVCTNCYLKLESTGKISKENGHQGWRRCLQGHRMVVAGFEDRDGGRKRILVKDLVGGVALRIELPESSTAAPPPGTQIWSWKDPAAGPLSKQRVSRPVTLSVAASTSATAASSPLTSSRFPPSGGAGHSARAIWAWFPTEDERDELSFPRGADVREAHAINEEWFWGVYAGGTGMFPGAYIRAAGRE
ncbi:MAG: hypothetical protein M1832_002669 [Thelocarpon impressellum]|nr:MAG: hypothetical protein M1832_002669 [Thelocarpon impressellum]